MEVYVFKERVNNGTATRTDASGEGVYVPELNVILYRSRIGAQILDDYLLEERPEKIAELKEAIRQSQSDLARFVSMSRARPVHRSVFSDFRRFEYDNAQLLSVVESLRQRDNLEGRIKEGMDSVLARGNQ